MAYFTCAQCRKTEEIDENRDPMLPKVDTCDECWNEYMKGYLGKI